MDNQLLEKILGKNTKEEIEKRAKSYIIGNSIHNINWSAWNDYLNHLAKSTDKKFIAVDKETGEIHPTLEQIPAVKAAANAFFELYYAILNSDGKDIRGNYFMVGRDKALTFDTKIKKEVKSGKGEKETTLMNHGDREKIVILQKDSFKSGDHERKWYTPEQLETHWEVAPSTANDIRSRLIRANAMESKRIDSHNHIYSLSEEYCFKGRTSNKNFSKVFQELFIKVVDGIQKEEKKLKKKPKYSALGTLQGLLPYSQRETNYIVKNPDTSILKLKKNDQGEIVKETIKEAFDREVEADPDKRIIKFMNQGGLAKGIGIDKRTIVKHLMQLQRYDAIKISINKDVWRIVVNPFLMISVAHSLNDKYFVQLCKDFKIHLPTEQEKKEIEKEQGE